MTDSATSLSTDSPSLPEVKCEIQLSLKSDGNRLLLTVPTEAQTPSSAISWAELTEQLKLRLRAGDRFWQPQSFVHLKAQDRLIDGRQLQAIATILSENQLHLQRVYTSRRQTAVAAATAGYSVEQEQPPTTLASKSTAPNKVLADPLYFQATVRSGIEIRHPGTVIILGDLNPGSNVVAAGDILVWGRLRGFVHAGAWGNSNCRIMALQMEPTQLRIADSVARAPEKLPTQFYAEVAYVTPQGIRITKATDFSKPNFVEGSRE